jgi:G6PDH family F420-dependent oxidoreductase
MPETRLRIGYALSSEEHRPLDLIRHAQIAEDAGFEFAMISDHYHPWIDRQGNSPFVWSVIGGLATATDHLIIGTGVTAPILRIHPAIIAQAAATSAAMLPGRFWFGVGTGENLNEHILGDPWPEHATRAEMLEEAVELIRDLWSGGLVSHHGPYYDVVRAQLYTLPDQPPPILVAASGEAAATLAARIGDGLITTSPEASLVRTYDDERDGDERGPVVGQVALCWGEDAAAARRTALEWWPQGAVKGDSGEELPMPSSFESLAELVSEESLAKVIPCGPDPAPVLDKIRSFVESGHDHVYLHQIGPDQEGFIRFAERELFPALKGLRRAA